MDIILKIDFAPFHLENKPARFHMQLINCMIELTGESSQQGRQAFGNNPRLAFSHDLSTCITNHSG